LETVGLAPRTRVRGLALPAARRCNTDTRARSGEQNFPESLPHPL